MYVFIKYTSERKIVTSGRHLKGVTYFLLSRKHKWMAKNSFSAT
jgi:hypothetical protein